MKKLLTLFPVVAFTALLLAGLAVSVISLKAVPDEEWIALKNPEKILSGKSTKLFTKLLNQNFVLGTAFNRIERGLQWNLTGDLGPSVRGGCDDWLFLTDELEVYPDRLKSAQFRAAVAAQLNARLKQRGINLLMVIVPDKTRIENRHLCGLRRSALFENRVVDWTGTLDKSGIEALNLTQTLTAMPGERYYHTDTHWNEAGADTAAQVIAADMGELKWASLTSATAVTLNTARTRRPGDLVHLAGLDGLPAFLRPEVELAQVTKVPPIAVASEDLFGDAGLPTIALIGTSYSRNSNFVPFLEHHLGATVANLAKDGGDFSGAATAYFAGATFRENPPKVVIWEVPERVIEAPVKDAERQWLEKLTRGRL